MHSSRTGKSIANLVANAASQLLAVLLAFVTRTAFLRVFRTDYLGLNALFADILGLLSVADLGLGTAMVYSFYKPLAEQDHQQLAALARFYRKVYRLIAAVSAGAGLCLIPVLPLLVRPEQPVPHLTVYYLFALADVTASYLCCSRAAVLNADQNNYVAAGIGMAVSVARTALQLAVILRLRSYAAYLAVSAAASIVRNLLVAREAARRYPFLRQQAELSAQDKRSIFRTTGAVFLYRASSLFLNATDNLLISLLDGTAAVGLYSNYLLVQSQLTGMVSLLFTSLTASVGNLIATEGAKRRFSVFRCEQTVSFLFCAVAASCYMALVNDFIVLWLGEAYLLPEPVVYAAGVNLYLGCVLQPLWSYREATGLYTRTKWVMTACAALNLVLSVLLGLRLGIAGILLASALSRLLTYIWYEPTLLFREYFGQSAAPYFRQLLGNAALTLGLTVCVCWAGRAFPAAAWGMWLVKAAAAGGFCLLAACAAYSRTEGMALLLARLKRLWH